jgi:hypothetical protein
VDMGVTLGWPAVAVLGFLVLTSLVVVLGSSSTARYEFERNRAREQQRSGAQRSGTHPAGSRHGTRRADATDAQPLPRAVGLAVRPAPVPAASGPGWWLVDDSALVLAGPFPDRLDADWAALADGLPAIPVFGTRRADGGVAPRPSPEERAWLGELSDQLDRLPTDWDALLSDTDPLTTLVVEVAAALVEAGLPLHEAGQGHHAGGVCLMPETASGGVLVSWRAHDRMSLQDLRGAAATDTVQQSMNAAVAEVLWNLGFAVEAFGATGSSLVTALR